MILQGFDVDEVAVVIVGDEHFGCWAPMTGSLIVMADISGCHLG
jgi:hypothetical protein